MRTHVAVGLAHDLEPIGEGCSACRVCHAFEGSLLTWCPGHALSGEALDACYGGNVIDFEGWQRYRHLRRDRR